VARHEAIEKVWMDRSGEPPPPVEDDEWRIWHELANLCPLCGHEMHTGLLDAPAWEPGVYEGDDYMFRTDLRIDKGMTIHRSWKITTEVGRIDPELAFSYEVFDEDVEDDEDA
jgi:hypothetical protein